MAINWKFPEVKYAVHRDSLNAHYDQARGFHAECYIAFYMIVIATKIGRNAAKY